MVDGHDRLPENVTIERSHQLFLVIMRLHFHRASNGEIMKHLISRAGVYLCWRYGPRRYTLSLPNFDTLQVLQQACDSQSCLLRPFNFAQFLRISAFMLYLCKEEDFTVDQLS
ncbi:hypothetical protein KIN20_003692 [Parelaphostrongylus tenuis]|uniref:Transposase n=1 Tax=Parelaphostrongylus tenuis TaxID=148309 RepID=A0AAD5MG45_PARTN|nr:hypothetical protein KIN20_003692 [Parelaphostrongylus tenuis]